MSSPYHGVLALRTKANLPAAQDTEAMFNRTVAIDWLYRLSGRTNGLYTGLWQNFQEKVKAGL